MVIDEATVTAVDQFLTFKISQETYAVEVAGVQRVLEYQPIMKVPGAPPYMRGVINVMGSVVPVIDMKQKFGMGETERTIDTCIVVLELDLDSERTLIGALADSVDEVIELGADSIEPAPRIGTSINRRYIRGIGKREDRFLMVLDFSEIFHGEELATLADGEGHVPVEQAT